MNDTPDTSNILTSLGEDVTAVVVGATGGIGSAFVKALADSPSVGRVYALARRAIAPASNKVQPGILDILDEDSIKTAADAIADDRPRLVIVATGILHDREGLSPEKSWRSLNQADMARVLAINTIGPALVAKHFLPLLPRKERGIFAALSARVGSIGDNGYGGWHSYRASKAALNMLIRNFAIELQLKQKQAVCVGLHPGTVDSQLSEPFQGNVPEGKLFSPDYSARKMLGVLDQLGPEDSGRVFDYAGKAITP